MSTLGYWNGKMAWDRADRKSERNPALSYSGSYSAWRLCRLDGHLAYTIVNDEELPDTPTTWDVYKKGVSPAPKIVVTVRALFASELTTAGRASLQQWGALAYNSGEL